NAAALFTFDDVLNHKLGKLDHKLPKPRILFAQTIDVSTSVAIVSATQKLTKIHVLAACRRMYLPHRSPSYSEVAPMPGESRRQHTPIRSSISGNPLWIPTP